MSCGLLPDTGIRVVSFPRRQIEVRSVASVRCSYYDRLGVSEGVTPDEIKKAYRQMARKYHPDVSPPDRTEECTRRFVEVREAYEILSDPRRRAAYDVGVHCADKRSRWKAQWWGQVSELESRSMRREDSPESVSWGERMRRRRST